MKRQDEWVEFVADLHKRLEAGEVQYGDASFQKPAPKTLGEVMEELLDVCGWTFVLYCRLGDLRRAATSLDK